MLKQLLIDAKQIIYQSQPQGEFAFCNYDRVMDCLDTYIMALDDAESYCTEHYPSMKEKG
jgi:hypothetical protein